VAGIVERMMADVSVQPACSDASSVTQPLLKNAKVYATLVHAPVKRLVSAKPGFVVQEIVPVERPAVIASLMGVVLTHAAFTVQRTLRTTDAWDQLPKQACMWGTFIRFYLRRGASSLSGVLKSRPTVS